MDRYEEEALAMMERMAHVSMRVHRLHDARRLIAAALRAAERRGAERALARIAAKQRKLAGAYAREAESPLLDVAGASFFVGKAEGADACVVDLDAIDLDALLAGDGS